MTPSWAMVLPVIEKQLIVWQQPTPCTFARCCRGWLLSVKIAHCIVSRVFLDPSSGMRPTGGFCATMAMVMTNGIPWLIALLLFAWNSWRTANGALTFFQYISSLLSPAARWGSLEFNLWRSSFSSSSPLPSSSSRPTPTLPIYVPRFAFSALLLVSFSCCFCDDGFHLLSAISRAQNAMGGTGTRSTYGERKVMWRAGPDLQIASAVCWGAWTRAMSRAQDAMGSAWTGIYARQDARIECHMECQIECETKWRNTGQISCQIDCLKRSWIERLQDWNYHVWVQNMRHMFFFIC